MEEGVQLGVVGNISDKIFQTFRQKRNGYFAYPKRRKYSLLSSILLRSRKNAKNMTARKSVLLPETVATGKMSFVSYSLFRITGMRKTEGKLNRKG